MSYRKKWSGGGRGGGGGGGGKTSSNSEEERIEIGHNRFMSVSVFNGKTNVSIRQYYEKDGQLLPGPKGITLSLEQWEMFKELIPDIDAELGE